MKLAGAEAARFLARPDPKAAGVLLHGPDAMRIALKRQALVAALIGPDGPAEMRLTRMGAAELRRDPALLIDALKATGFFPGPRAVLVEDASEAQAAPILAALADWRAGDAALVVAAGELKAASSLRKGFEAARAAVAIAVHADPPGRAEIEASLARAGVTADRAGMADLEALARALDPGDFAQFLGKLALYKHGDAAPASPEDIAALAPAHEAVVDGLLDLAAEGKPDGLAEAMPRLGGGASAATALVIAAGRRFRLLHMAACSAEGAEAALSRARPPVFGPRRARLADQARAFGPARLETALGWILETDLSLRSTRPPPGLAAAERLLVRIATLRRG